MRRYRSLNDYLKDTFGEKVYKLALDGGMTCPNRDGTKGTGGCIFCSEGGSGDFAERYNGDVQAQITNAVARISGKTKAKEIYSLFSKLHKHLCAASVSRKAVLYGCRGRTHSGSVDRHKTRLFATRCS